MASCAVKPSFPLTGKRQSPSIEDNMAHKLEIYYPAQDDFDEERALNVLSSLYCT
jgi:hypothetical protein